MSFDGAILEFFRDFGNDLFENIIDMCSSFVSANTIDKTDLLKFSIRS